MKMLLVSLLLSSALSGAEMSLIDGRLISGSQVAFSAGVWSLDGQDLAAAQVEKILFGDSLGKGGAAQGSAVFQVALRDGGELRAQILGGDASALRLDLSWREEPLRLPLQLVAALAREGVRAPEAQTGTDVLLARSSTGQESSLAVTFLGMDEHSLRIRYQDSKRELDRGRMQALVFAGGAQPQSMSLGCMTCDDGSCLQVAGLSIAEGLCRLRLAGLDEELILPLEKLRNFQLANPRIRTLSSGPVSVIAESSDLAYPSPMQRGSGVHGGPLRIGVQDFVHGLGVHADSHLRVGVPGQSQRLLGAVGIDAASGERGDCLARIVGNGQELFSAHLRGGEPAQVFAIDLAGLSAIDLIVESGDDPDRDLGDRVIWAEPRFILAGEEP